MPSKNCVERKSIIPSVLAKAQNDKKLNTINDTCANKTVYLKIERTMYKTIPKTTNNITLELNNVLSSRHCSHLYYNMLSHACQASPNS